MCELKWSITSPHEERVTYWREKHLPHEEQLKGFSLVCERMCRERCSSFENDKKHQGQIRCRLARARVFGIGSRDKSTPSTMIQVLRDMKMRNPGVGGTFKDPAFSTPGPTSAESWSNYLV